MVNTSYLHEVCTMNEQQFLDIAQAGDKFVLVNVVPVDGSTDWTIFGPYGVYVSIAGSRTFPDLSAAHSQLAEWGIRRFFQVGELKVFPGATS